MGHQIRYVNVDAIDRSYRNATVLNRSSRCLSINQKIIEKFNSDSFRLKRCFIIAGGGSLKGFDYHRLDGQFTIGINKTFQYYSEATINYSMDQDFYDKIYNGFLDRHSGIDVKQKWLDFKGTRVFLCPLTIKQFDTDVYLVKRTNSDIISRDLDYGIYPGRNSAMGALMLAIALGANPIYLLGYDMHAKESSHWHDGYPNRDLAEFNLKLERYRQEFDAVAPEIENAGVEVFNLNPVSALKCFRFKTVEEVLGDG